MNETLHHESVFEDRVRRWEFKRRGMIVVVQKTRDHDQQYDFDPETYIGEIGFNPQGFASEYSARVLSGLNSFTMFFDAMNDGRPRPDILVSDTNKSMARMAKSMGFEVYEREESEQNVTPLNKYRIIGNTDAVEKSITALKEKKVRDGRLLTDVLQQRNNPLNSTPEQSSLPLQMIMAMGQNGHAAAGWLELIKRDNRVPERDLVVFGMQTPEEESRPEMLFGHRQTRTTRKT